MGVRHLRNLRVGISSSRADARSGRFPDPRSHPWATTPLTKLHREYPVLVCYDGTCKRVGNARGPGTGHRHFVDEANNKRSLAFAG